MAPPETGKTGTLLWGGAIALLFLAGARWWVDRASIDPGARVESPAFAGDSADLDPPESLLHLTTGSRDHRVSGWEGGEAETPGSDAPRAATTSSGAAHVLARWTDSGRPATDLLVSLRPWRNGGAARHGRCQQPTDQDGRTTFLNLAPGDYVVGLATGSSERATRLTVESGATVEAELFLAEGISISGVVLDAAGARVSGADVVWVDGLGEPERVGVSGETGSFRVEGVLDDGYLFAERAGDAPSARHLCELGAGSQQGVVLQLRGPGASLEGLVVDGYGEPVPGARVSLGTSERLTDAPHPSDVPGWNRPARLRAVTDRDGGFTFAGVAPVSWRMVVDHPDFAPLESTVALIPGASESLHLTLGEGAVVWGTLTDRQGAPVRDGVIYSPGETPDRLGYDRLATTQPDGTYEMRGLGRSAHRRFHAHVEGQVGSAEAFLDLTAATRVEWNPVLRPLAGLSGVLINDVDEPLRGFMVVAMGSGSWIDNAMTAGDGSFTLTQDLSLATDLSVLRPAAEGRPLHIRAIHVERDVLPAASPIVIRVLEGELAVGAVKGHVVDTSGHLPAGTEVQIKAWGFPLAQVSVFGVDGWFEITDLCTGRFDVEITAPDRAPWKGVVEIETDRTTDLGDIRLGRGGQLEWDAASLQSSSWPDSTEASVWNGAGESPEPLPFEPNRTLGPLAEGEYTVRLSAPGYALAVNSVSVFDGETTTVAVPAARARQGPVFEVVGIGEAYALLRARQASGDTILPTFMAGGDDPLRVELPGLPDGDYVLEVETIGQRRAVHRFSVRNGSGGSGVERITLR
ncbi:PEGA domain protein [Planctomycetes bacterium Poly30]|uniref:PEGA domain protein n=1 Tax=Saltatorellus ferox TaxID=2528018 RepID=A0A518EYX2_9BACT|nr:PEGA domain protein [Planctomycetes bacterium Poly30]